MCFDEYIDIEWTNGRLYGFEAFETRPSTKNAAHSLDARRELVLVAVADPGIPHYETPECGGSLRALSLPLPFGVSLFLCLPLCSLAYVFFYPLVYIIYKASELLCQGNFVEAAITANLWRFRLRLHVREILINKWTPIRCTDKTKSK